MQIGRLAKTTGFSRDTIRYYEKIGLIELPREKTNGSYKNYDQTIQDRLLTIKQLKRFGFTLNEMKWMFSFEEEGMLSCRDMGEMADKKIAEVEEQIKKLTIIKKRLVKGIRDCAGDCDEVINQITAKDSC